MRKNNNQNRNMKHRGGQGGGQRRYQNNGGGNGGGNRGNDSGNIARQKHHATQMLGKYGDMARNAQINGDRVDVEFYLQHVDHYTRVLTDIAAIEAERFAHHREQQVASGHAHESNGQDQQGGQSEQGEQQPAGEANEGEQQATEGNADAAPAAPRQPRPARQRRPHHSQSDNGAKEANANTTDIPLPDGILPPV